MLNRIQKFSNRGGGWGRGGNQRGIAELIASNSQIGVVVGDVEVFCEALPSKTASNSQIGVVVGDEVDFVIYEMYVIWGKAPAAYYRLQSRAKKLLTPNA